MKRLAAVLLVASLLTACDEGESVIFPEPPPGPAGPTGPTGPTGPQGPPGARTTDTIRITTTIRIVDTVRVPVYVSTTGPKLKCNGIDPKNWANPPAHWAFHAPFPIEELQILCTTVS